jgi:hypothetical protein
MRTGVGAGWLLLDHSEKRVVVRLAAGTGAGFVVCEIQTMTEYILHGTKKIENSLLRITP